MLNRLLLTVFVLIALVGCSAQGKAQRDASRLALVVQQQVITLKQQLQAKIAAEQRFYDKAVETLNDSKERTKYIDLAESMLDKSDRDAARFAAKPDTVDADTLASILASRANDWVNKLDAADEKIRQQQAEIVASIEKLNTLNMQYAALERTLQRLSIPPSQRENLARLAEFVLDSAKHMKKLDDERKKSSKSQDNDNGR